MRPTAFRLPSRSIESTSTSSPSRNVASPRSVRPVDVRAASRRDGTESDMNARPSPRRAARGEARDRHPSAGETQRVPVESVGTVSERDAALGIAPSELSTGAVVTEHQRRSGLAEAAIRPVLVASDEDAERAVRALAEVEVGEIAGPDLAGRANHRRRPHLVAVVRAAVGE